MRELLEDEKSIIGDIQSHFYLLKACDSDYELSFERDVNNKIIRVDGVYNKVVDSLHPVRFSFPCFNNVLHSGGDEPGVLYYLDEEFNYDEYWFFNGEMTREKKPFQRTIRDGGVVTLRFNHPSRQSVFPRRIEFRDDGSLYFVGWAALESREDNVLVDLFYHESGFVSTKLFGLNNMGVLAGVKLEFFDNGEQLKRMSKFNMGVSIKDYDVFEYYESGGLRSVCLGLGLFELPSSVTQPAVREYDTTGNIISEEYWIEGEQFESRKEWLIDERVSEHKRELYNENSIVTNVSL